MHREVLGIPEGLVDHRNRNGLDNGRARLCVATYCAKSWNARKRRGGTRR